MSRVRTFANKTAGVVSTATGYFPSTDGIDLHQVVGSVAVNYTHGTTKDIAFMPQGSLGGIHWTNLNAAATTTTSTGNTRTGVVNSTVAGSYNRVRINVTANASTGAQIIWAVGGRP